LTVQDFERYIRHELGIQQIDRRGGRERRVGDTAGSLRALYARENEELSVQAVFFGVKPPGERHGDTGGGAAVLHQPDGALPPARADTGQLREIPGHQLLGRAVQEINQITNLAERLEAVYQERKTNVLFRTTPRRPRKIF
jgi:hypothetical protein